MAKSNVRIMCWGRSHVTDLVMNKAQEQKLEAAIPKLKKVCPVCKPENCAITIVTGATIFNPSKAYRCEKGHLSLIGTLGKLLNVAFGPEEFVNVEGSLEDLPNLIDAGDIACNHVVDGKVCDCKLVAVDDFVLSYPHSPAVKTKMRIGDLWDRQGVTPVRNGQYNKDGVYQESESQKKNAARLNRMRRDRNMAPDRHPGRRIDRATKKDYGRRDKGSLDL